VNERAPLETAETVGMSVGRIIGEAMPPGWGFALILFTMGDSGPQYASYVSNGQRADMIKALRECADKIESRQDNR
jgi:hypothetical protein